MLIMYCETCGFRIQEEDLNSGKATQLAENRYNCPKCSAAAAPAPAPKRATTGSVTTQLRHTPDGGTRPPSSVTSAIRPKSTVIRASAQGVETEADSEKRVVRKPLPLVPIVGGATILLVVVAMFIALSQGEIAPVAKNDPAKNTEPPKNNATVAPPQTQPTPPTQPTQPIERPEDRMRRAMEETARTTTKQDATPANTLPSTTKGTGPQMLAQQDPIGESAFNERAVRMLKEVQDWGAKNSSDPWTYKEKLESFAQTYRSAPAGADAKKLASEVKIPAGERPSERSNWHRDWTISSGASQATFHEEMDGRRFIYQSHPVSNGVPCVTSRSFVVPADRPFFELRIRAHEAGDCRFVVAVSGFEMMSENLGGKDWRNFAFDLTGMKGQPVEIELIHHNTGWNAEFAYMQTPRFIDKPASDAKVYTWDAKNTAAAIAKSAPGTLDLLAACDPAADSVNGQWSKTSEGLLGSMGKDNRIQFPYIPPAEYDLNVSFTRRTGSNCVTFMGSHGDREFLAMLAGWDGKFAGFSRIDNKNIDTNASKLDFNSRIKNGQKHTAVLEVRNDRLRMLFDGQPLLEFKTDYSNLDMDPSWKPRDRLWLALGTFESVYLFHSIDVVEIGTRGRIQRPNLIRKAGDAAPQPAPAAVGSAPATSAGNVDAEYAAASDDAFGIMAKGNVRAAREQIEKLNADSRFSALKAKLALDLALAKLAENNPRSVVKGAQALNDGRPFVLQQANGKNLTVGRGTKNNVKDASDALITVEQDLGGGKALTRVAVDQLTQQTRFELARIGAAADPDGDVQTALNAMLLIRSGQGEFNARAIRSMLDAAKKKPAHAKLAEHLAERFESASREQAAEQLYQKADQAYAARKMDDAKKLLETLEKDHGNTAFWARNRSNVAKINEEVSKALFPLTKGLMFEYCRAEGGERFKEVKLRRAETKLNFDWSDKEPAPGVDPDFSVRMKGILRIEKGGRYGFSLRADDAGKLMLDDKLVVEASTFNDREGEIDLTPGDHVIYMEHQDTGGPATFQLRWRLVGSFDLQDIPESALWHDPKVK